MIFIEDGLHFIEYLKAHGLNVFFNCFMLQYAGGTWDFRFLVNSLNFFCPMNCPDALLCNGLLRRVEEKHGFVNPESFAN